MKPLKKVMQTIILLFWQPAHPAKFPKVYEELQIKLSSLPKGLHDLEKKKEYLHTFNTNYNDIKDFIKLNN
jgi:threonine synthase